MNKYKITFLTLALSNLLLAGCQSEKTDVIAAKEGLVVDVLITSGKVFTGEMTGFQSLDVALCGDEICGLFASGSKKVIAKTTIHAQGKLVSPGFIDPHTHSLAELKSTDKNHNLNYLSQGVTTVVNGNDGGGPVAIDATVKQLSNNGIGTNVALFVGHGSLRDQVIGRENRFATADEIARMQALLAEGMKAGALGLSSGLYYVPQNYANTEEVIALAKVASEYGGIYDTHLRDESTFSVGLLPAVNEAIDIATQAKIPLHIAHIKALGVDVWGQSSAVIQAIETAQASGVTITADQYPWLASGTKLHNAVMPKWLMAGSKKIFFARLNDKSLQNKIIGEINENIRKRGGPSSLLITAFKQPELVGKTLEEIARLRNKTPAKTAIMLVQEGEVRVASFNMSEDDLAKFMVKPWVVTSSDGTNGHPRKYASFPQKYQEYVVKQPLISVDRFLYNSSTATAKLLGLHKRGQLKVGYKADVIVLDEAKYQAKADFSNWNRYSTGIDTVIVNGVVTIDKGLYTGALSGRFVQKSTMEESVL